MILLTHSHPLVSIFMIHKLKDKIENDKRDPSLNSLNSICEAINVPLSIFILLAENTANDSFSEITELLKSTARSVIGERN